MVELLAQVMINEVILISELVYNFLPIGMFDSHKQLS